MHTHTQNLVIFVTDTQKHSSSTRVWAANTEMHLWYWNATACTKICPPSTKYCKQEHKQNKQIHAISSGSQVDSTWHFLLYWRILKKRELIYTYWNIFGFFLAILVIFAISWSEFSGFSTFQGQGFLPTWSHKIISCSPASLKMTFRTATTSPSDFVPKPSKEARLKSVDLSSILLKSKCF